MNAQINIPRFNALEAYERERDINRRLFRHLSDVLFVADDMVRKLERHGYDVSHKRAILDKARRERLDA